MNAGELTDTQLDALLGQVPSPAAPDPALAERIVAQAVASSRLSAGRSAIFRRRRFRRSPALWTVVIAANALAAAAAASSWDGQRFDFHRLADLPHRVAAVIHLPHRHARELPKHDRTAPLSQSRKVAAHSAMSSAPAPIIQMPVPVTVSKETVPQVYRPMRAVARPAARYVPHRKVVEEARAQRRPERREDLVSRRASAIRPAHRSLERPPQEPRHEIMSEPPLPPNQAMAQPRPGDDGFPERSVGKDRREPNPQQDRIGRPRRSPDWNRRPFRQRGGGRRRFGRRF